MVVVGPDFFSSASTATRFRGLLAGITIGVPDGVSDGTGRDLPRPDLGEPVRSVFLDEDLVHDAFVSVATMGLTLQSTDHTATNENGALPRRLM